MTQLIQQIHEGVLSFDIIDQTEECGSPDVVDRENKPGARFTPKCPRFHRCLLGPSVHAVAHPDLSTGKPWLCLEQFDYIGQAVRRRCKIERSEVNYEHPGICHCSGRTAADGILLRFCFGLLELRTSRDRNAVKIR